MWTEIQTEGERVRQTGRVIKRDRVRERGRE